MFKLVISVISALTATQVNGQLWRADYFKDEVMRFTTNECWQNQPVDPKPEGSTRIAVVGDSTALGVGSKRSMLDFMYDYHFQMDGSKAGFKGFPYLLNSLLSVHNSTQHFQTLNFANDNFTLLEGAMNKTYKDTCEYRQLMTSNPDIVVSMLGAKESLNQQKFTPEAFISAYTSFIKEFDNMPSKPLFILVTPIYSAASVLAVNKPFMLNELDGSEFIASNTSLGQWQHKGADMSVLVAKVAEATQIPFENVVDSEKVIKLDNTNTMNDTIHPNEHGYGVLAQQIYMRLALSQKLKNRAMQLYQTNLTVPDLQDFMAKMVQEQKNKRSLMRTPTSSSFMLLQEMSRIRIKLSQTCTDQSYYQAKEALLPGNKFNFQVPSPKQNEIRIAIAGDSTTQGCCGTTLQQIESMPKEKRLSDQSDGTQQGLQGWPYLLGQLLKNNNKTIDYTIMNYGVAATTIIPNVKFQSFYDNCRYEQLKKSLPNFVFFSFGSMDTHLKKFSEDKFITSYVDLIKETQDLPSKPMVFLMTPTFNCENKLNLQTSGDKLDEWTLETKDCNAEQKKDLNQMIKKVANQTGIPDQHIVNAYSMLRNPNRKVPGIFQDNVHPNVKGMGEIAQEFFMKMSLSQDYLEQQNKILHGEDDIFNKAIEIAYQKQDWKDLM